MTLPGSRSLDDARRRRLKYVVHFERPNKKLRKRLWLSLMPEGVALADDIDLDRLAALFDFTGADIRSMWMTRGPEAVPSR